MKRFICFSVCISASAIICCQTLSFRRVDLSTTIESIFIFNQSTGDTITIAGNWDDYDNISVNAPRFNVQSKSFVYPNPFQGMTHVNFSIENEGLNEVTIYNSIGQKIAEESRLLNTGMYTVEISLSETGVYFLNVTGDNSEYSQVLINSNSSIGKNAINYINNTSTPPESSVLKNSDLDYFDFSPGDNLLYEVKSGDNITVIADRPIEDTEYYVEFAKCEDKEGNNYKIVQIGNQWWMAENLAFLPEVISPDSGSFTSPFNYVYDYWGTDVDTALSSENYKTYGALYNWPAVMAGEESSNNIPSGVQGVCPDNWHLPSDKEITLLSLYLLNHGFEYEGIPLALGKSIASTTFWESGYSDGDIGVDTLENNTTGFTGLPAGRADGAFLDPGGFYFINEYAYWWTCTSHDNAYSGIIQLTYWKRHLNLGRSLKTMGASVRCIKD